MKFRERKMLRHRKRLMCEMANLTIRASARFLTKTQRLHESDCEFKRLVVELGGPKKLHLSRGRRAKVKAKLAISKFFDKV